MTRTQPGNLRSGKVAIALLSAISWLSLSLRGSGLPLAQAEERHPLIEAVEQVFQRSQSEDLKEYGLDNSTYAPNGYSHSIKGCWLKVGEGKIYTPTLQAGVEYAVIGGGDKNAVKLKIQILDPGGIRSANEKDPVLTESSEDNNHPAAVFKLKKTQGAGIRIVLEEVDKSSGNESAYAAFVLLRKEGGWEVPMVNLKQAAARLEKRLDKVRAANGNDAGLAADWFSIHGGIIPKGGSSRNGHNLDKNASYVAVVTSDDNADALDVSLSGVLRAPKPEERDDEDPKITYRAGPKSQFSAEHLIKNPQGDNPLVLIGIVQINNP